VRLCSLITLALGLWATSGVATDAATPPCSMQPGYVEIPIPDRGLSWLGEEELEGECEEVPKEKWARGRSGSRELFVYADGPEGSGRFWGVTVGLGRPQAAHPLRGVCLVTSTVAWRALQRFRRLEWLDDVDEDGSVELVLWTSFSLGDRGSPVETGLVAWVYRLTPDGVLVIDPALTRRVAEEIEAAYRQPLPQADPALESLRTAAADALSKLADQDCTIREQATKIPPIHRRVGGGHLSDHSGGTASAGRFVE